MSNNEQQKTSEEGPKKIEIMATEEARKGVFANHAIVYHRPEEFMIDFVLLSPPEGKANLNARVILTPSHFKRLVNAMNANLTKYEEKFGKVPESVEERKGHKRVS